MSIKDFNRVSLLDGGSDLSSYDTSTKVSVGSSEINIAPVKDSLYNFFSEKTINNILTQKNITELNNKILNELNKHNREAAALTLEDVSLKASKVVSLKEELNNKMDAIQTKRLNLYENLITTALAQFYYEKLNNSFADCIDAKILDDAFNSSEDNGISEKLSALSRVASIMNASDLSSSTVTIPDLTLEIVKNMSKSFLDIYEELKSYAGLENTIITYRGVESSDEMMLFKDDVNSEISGSILFKNQDGDNLRLTDLKDINSIKLTVTTDLDMQLQDGSKENPYIINSSEDFKYKYILSENAQNLYFILNADIEINENFIFKNNLNGNGHVISIYSTDIGMSASSNIKNLSLRSINLSNLEMAGSLENIDIVLLNSNLLNSITFKAKYSTDGDSLLLNTLNNVKVYSKKQRHISIKNNDNSATKLILELDESGLYYSLVLNNTNVSNDPITMNPSSYENEKNYILPDNKIIEKGTVLFDGILEVSAGSSLRFENSEKTVSVIFDQSYRGSFEIEKLTYNDSFDITKNLSKLSFSGSSYSSGYKLYSASAVTLNSLANIASYYFLDEKISHGLVNSDKDLVSGLLNEIAIVSQALKSSKSEVSTNMESSIKTASNVVQSFLYLESFRSSQDEMYNTDYTKNLISMFNAITGYIELTGSTYNTEESIDPYKNIKLYIEAISSEITTLVIGLTESINIINKEIENYQIFHTNKNTYGTKLGKICKVFEDIYSENSESFSLILPSIRKYTNWRNEFSIYSNDGVISEAQLYILQEICINSLGYDIENTSLYNQSLKLLVSNIISKMISKKLLYSKNGNLISIDAIDYEEALLKDYNIYVHSDAGIENIPFQISDISSALGTIDELDVSNILLDSDNPIYNTEKIENIINASILSYIFTDSLASNIILRILKLDSLINNCTKNFKLLLFEYHFRKLVNKIYESAKNNTSSILNSSYQSISGVINFSKVEELVNKYIAVWLFKYYSEYSKTGSIFKVIDQPELTKFMYNYSEIEVLKKFELKMTSDKLVNKINSKIKDIWNKMVDFVGGEQ